ncbi:hypothetical protein HXX01_00140 [Candidatus Nomurabacteria bacterium]|nr:hypothetical protein [Candidatus Nomurabacteria bacterium]
MKKLSTLILISFILLTNFIIPITVSAAVPDLLTVVNFTQPKDGELGTSTSSYDFSLTYKAPSIKEEVASPNTNYNIFFQPYCDGAAAINGSKYIYNKSKFITGLNTENQTILWNSNIVCPYYAKTLRWTLTEVDSTQKTIKTYVDTSFNFKLNESYKGYYYIYKNSGGVYSSSGVFKDNASCLTDSNNFISKNTTSKIYSECQYYSDIPSIPKTDESVPVDPINVAENKTVYNMLAPIGQLKTMNPNTGGCAPTDPTCIGNNVGDYLNIIFKFAIGIAAALAVIMLILSGVQYMGDESIFGKTEAKSKMRSAILGLLIALGAWALLNTISPALTGKGGVNIDTASVEITPLYDRGYDDPKNANGESTNCKVVTDSNSPCTPDKLEKIFPGKGIQMSKICSMESGGVENRSSGTDYCNPPSDKSLPFSFGLFQVNLSANGVLAGPECVGLFDKAVKGSDAIEPKYKNGYTCSLTPGKETLYTTCKNKLLDTATNLSIAKSLFNNSKGMGNWNGDKRYCASAFQ